MKKAKILVADDEVQLFEMLNPLLKAEGYDVITARDGEQALKKIYGEKPDLIILDILMPRKDGTEVGHILRSDERTKHIPIIFLTVLREEQDVEGDGSIVMGKPIEAQKLLSKVKELL